MAGKTLVKLLAFRSNRIFGVGDGDRFISIAVMDSDSDSDKPIWSLTVTIHWVTFRRR